MAFFAVNVPEYVFANTFAGTEIEMGLVVKAASVTAAKLLAGDALQEIL